MTQISRAALNTEIDTNINDNSAGDISASDVRTALKDLADSCFNITTEAVTKTELGYVAGVTSAIQTQLNAKQASGTYLTAANNLSDVTTPATARTNLGLGTLATQSGTFSGTSSGTNTGDQTISDATISTSDITTNNVSTSKHGFTPKAPNDATKFLDGTGAWTVPAGGSGGSYVWLSRTTISGAPSTVDFTSIFTSTYDTYVIVVNNFTTTTNGRHLQMRISSDNGSTFKAGSTDYAYLQQNPNTDATAISYLISAGNTQISICNFVGNATGDGASCIITLGNMNVSTGMIAHIETGFRESGTSRLAYQMGKAAYIGSAITPNAIRFLCSSSDTMATGTIDVYGLKHA